MMLVADSGSTKTDWRLIDRGEITAHTTIGFNPYHISPENVTKTLAASSLKTVAQDVVTVHFYGAGCSAAVKRLEIMATLKSFFSNAEVHVYHDLLGAARATCKHDEGLVAILGTGSNSCVYNGEKIIQNIPALGYVLGDEGSGSYLGRLFVKAYLEKRLSKDLSSSFLNHYQLKDEQILDAVYKGDLPNRFLAQFSSFIYEHLKHEEMYKLVRCSFEEFFRHHICGYDNYKSYNMHVVGSIGYVYQDIFKEVVLQHEMVLGTVIKQPIDELITYHV